MKKIVLLLILSLNLSLQSQTPNNFDGKIDLLTKQIDSIVNQKNKELKLAFEKINQDVKDKKISKEEAESRKKELAKQYADDLDYLVFKLTSQMKDVVKNDAVVRKIIYKKGDKEFSYTFRVIKNNKKKKNIKKHKKRTYGKWFISFGMNNVIAGKGLEAINNSPYGLWQSRNFSFGKEWKTSFSKKPGPLYFTYGINYSWETFKPMNNKYHVVRNDSLFLETYSEDLKYSKLRAKWFSFPIGLEIHIPKARHRYLKIKTGTYVKINVSTKQKLKLAGGSHEKIIDKANYNVNNFNYGLFGEIGGKNWSVFTKYDMIDFFKTKDWKHFSLGLKFEL